MLKLFMAGRSFLVKVMKTVGEGRMKLQLERILFIAQMFGSAGGDLMCINEPTKLAIR